ncbi:MAG: YciI-like protein [Candidatus Aminicenantales bacterium]
MYYVLIYKTVDDYVAKRAPYRAGHLAYAGAAQERGELIMAGALADPVDMAILIFRAESRAVVEDFARHDPYVKSGLIVEWSVRPWTVVIGG